MGFCFDDTPKTSVVISLESRISLFSEPSESAPTPSVYGSPSVKVPFPKELSQFSSPSHINSPSLPISQSVKGSP